VHKRSITITVALLVVGLIAGVGPAQAKNTRTSAKDGPPPTIVRGGYIDDGVCRIPTSVPSVSDDAQVIEFECKGTALWNGGFTGRTLARYRITFATSGRVFGTYEEMFVGNYAGDNSYGGLLTRGSFEVIDGQHSARAEIVSGTCAWAGSTGSMNFDGSLVYGGYVAQWNRPAVTPAADPTCNPLGSFIP